MAKFEDFPIYKKVLEHTKNIYSLINKSDFKTEFEFKNQSNKQFVRFLIYAKGSCAEVRNMVNISFELGFISENEKDLLIRENKDISVSLGKFIKYLDNISDNNKE